MSMIKEVKCGLHLHYAPELLSAIQNATNSGYNFIVTHLVHPRSQTFTPYCDLQLSSSGDDWGSVIVAQISNYDLQCANPLPNAAKLTAEVTYAMHLGLSALIFECPSKSEGIAQLSRVINSKVSLTGGFQNLPHFWIQIPIQAPNDRSNVWRNDVDADDEHVNGEDTWLWWNQLRNQVTPDKHVSVALELSGDLPDEMILNRWMSEPLKAIILPTSIFMTNRKNYPVLSRAYQTFVRDVIFRMARDVYFIIKGNSKHEDIRYYAQYIEHIKSAQMPSDAVIGFSKGYEDYLQIPLQPLMDNLESCTYEVFERDPVKYEEYGKAIYEAMKNYKCDNKEMVVMVLGAGRGPLVERSLKAAEKCEIYAHIYAVEKNPNAIVTLNSLRDQRWGGENGVKHGKVEVIACDMRDWDAPQKADLVVSELLGSFGDNELSPECLDGVWSYVKETAISIPSSYTSYLAPIQSQRLYTEAINVREKDKTAVSVFETGYVVHMRNVFLIDEPQPLFTFEHKDLLKKPSERDNSRFSLLHFKSKIASVCHGFGGYFDATLYGDIKISIVPSSHTPGMFSWFPIFFPIQIPVHLKTDDHIELNFWRLINKRQIWYEWCLSAPISTPIHNPNGRSYSIGLL